MIEKKKKRIEKNNVKNAHNVLLRNKKGILLMLQDLIQIVKNKLFFS